MNKHNKDANYFWWHLPSRWWLHCDIISDSSSSDQLYSWLSRAL